MTSPLQISKNEKSEEKKEIQTFKMTGSAFFFGKK